MKKLLKVILCSIICYLCIVSYGSTKAENETETETQTETTTTTTTTETTSEETTSEEKEENKETSENTEGQNTQAPEESSESNNKQPSTSSGSSTVRKTQTQNTTKVEAKKSTNANLSDLGITPNDFKGFTPTTLNYAVTVPNDVDKVNVYAKVQDSKAKITSGTGTHNLDEGENSLQIVVTAESGDTQTYTINVTREKATDNNQETTSTEKEISDLKKLEIKGYTLTPAFSADVYEYKLEVKKDVTSIEVLAEGANDKVNIEVVGNTELKDGENIITVLVKNTETNKNSTYQIIVNKQENNTVVNNARKKANRIRLILIGLFLAVVLGIIIFFVVRHKKMKNEEVYEEDDEEYSEEESNEEEVLDLDNEEELFKRVNKSKFKMNDYKETDTIINEKKEDNNTENKEQTTLTDEYFRRFDNNSKGKHF